jgi:hypothetical protein
MALQNLVHHNRLSIFRCIFMLNGPHNRFFFLSHLSIGKTKCPVYFLCISRVPSFVRQGRPYSWSEKACNQPERARGAAGKRGHLVRGAWESVVRSRQYVWERKMGVRERKSSAREGKRILDGERRNSSFLASGSRGMEDPKN